jgi:hypothetical protein
MQDLRMRVRRSPELGRISSFLEKRKMRGEGERETPGRRKVRRESEGAVPSRTPEGGRPDYPLSRPIHQTAAIVVFGARTTRMSTI